MHAYYEEDPRVRRQAESLVAHGWAVDVFGLRREGEAPQGVVEGVTVHRLDVRRHQGAGVGIYLWEYVSFFVRAALAAAAAHRRRRFTVAQAASLPDFLVFALLPLRLAAGTPLVLDLHEAMPEFFRSRFPGAASPLALRLLGLQERLSIDVSDAVMTVNDALGDRLLALGVPRDKLTVLLNSPDLSRFDPAAHAARPFMADGTLRLVYAGALTPTYELDVVLEALARLRERRPDLPLSLGLYGRGDSATPLRAQAERLGLAEHVTLHGRIPIEAVAAAIAAADVGLAPTRRDRFTDYSLSTKLFEYAAMGKPVVATRLPTVERYFAPETLVTYAAGDADDLATAILSLVDEPAARAARVEATHVRILELSWDREMERYLAMLARLTAGPPT